MYTCIHTSTFFVAKLIDRFFVYVRKKTYPCWPPIHAFAVLKTRTKSKTESFSRCLLRMEIFVGSSIGSWPNTYRVLHVCECAVIQRAFSEPGPKQPIRLSTCRKNFELIDSIWRNTHFERIRRRHGTQSINAT